MSATQPRLPLLVTLAVFGCSACVNGHPDPAAWTHADVVTISPPGTVIEATDGSFRLMSGDEIPTPFLTYDCPARPTTANAELGLRLGGRPVIITHPEVEGHLYGVLSICHVHPEASPLVQRLYDIRVDSSRVAQTSGGRVAVVYEPHGPPMYYQEEPEVRVPAWALWMSRRPFR